MDPSTYDEVVRLALCNGVSTLEAAGMPGGDEALADAFRKAVSQHPEIADRTIDVLLRVGYRENSEVSFPGDIAQPNTGVLHNLSDVYIQRTLQESAFTKLCQEFPECVRFTPMLHNPEAQGDGTLDSRWHVHDILVTAFRALEDWCAGWQDNSFVTRYGVVSNGLNLSEQNEDHPMALPVDILTNAVDRATASRGKHLHSTYFGAIQLPINLLEGSKVAEQLREVSGRTQLYGMRPLHCYPDRGMGQERPWLLADYLLDGGKWTNEIDRPPAEYDAALKRVLGHLDADDLDESESKEGKEETLEAARLLQSIIQDLDACLSRVRSLQEYHDILTQHIEPLAQIEAMDDETASLLGSFFQQHGQAARFAVSQRTRDQLLQVSGSAVEDTKAKLQELGLFFAVNHADTVIVTCSSIEHVREAIQIINRMHATSNIPL